MIHDKIEINMFHNKDFLFCFIQEDIVALNKLAEVQSKVQQLLRDDQHTSGEIFIEIQSS